MNRYFLALICVAFTLSSSFGQQPSTSTPSSNEPQSSAPGSQLSQPQSSMPGSQLSQPHTSQSTSSTGQPHSSTSTPSPRRRHTFTTNDTAFLLDGKPFQIISGEMHYPRVPRAAWRQRMRMAKAMGINTIGTYVFWNLQEPEKGVFDFSGNNDIAAFVRIAQDEGLWVLLRPSPYVCAEWEFGGYPYWLQNIPGLVVRSKEPQYLREYQRYIQRLGKELSPLLVTNGGNILMVQVENEYGSYASDKEYLETNRKMFLDAGFNCLLNTCDPAKDIAKGTTPAFLPAINGDNSPEKVKEIINGIHDGKGPYFMAEWYPAWFDWWGEPHHTVPAEKYARQLDSVLSAGISINMYMFHGGTTRGFMNGANCYDTSFYQPQVSSYDYDAPLDEAGNATEKFMVFRSVIARHLPKGRRLPAVPAPKPTIMLPAIVFNEQTPLVDMLPVPKESPHPLTFEELHQAYGYVLYRATIPAATSATASSGITDPMQTSHGPSVAATTDPAHFSSSGALATYGPAVEPTRSPANPGPARPSATTSSPAALAGTQASTSGHSATYAPSAAEPTPPSAAGPTTALLRIEDVRDYAIVFVNGKRQGVLDRMKKQDSLMISVPAEGATLDILVENMGRINFGPNLLKNHKGITKMVSFNNQELRGWKMYSFPFDHVDAQWSAASHQLAQSVTSPGTPASPATTSNAPTVSASAQATTTEMPTLKKATFHLDAIGDTYLDMRPWGKGCVWINGHNLGRYWEIGPQQTIYVPAEWLKKGDNTVEVLELIKPEQNELKSLEKPILAELHPEAH